MNYRVIVPADRSEDCVTNDLDRARIWCMELSEEYGYAEVKRNLCGPEPIIGSYTNGR